MGTQAEPAEWPQLQPSPGSAGRALPELQITWRGCPRYLGSCSELPAKIPHWTSPGRTGVLKATPVSEWVGWPPRGDQQGPRQDTCVQCLEGVPALPCWPLASACRWSKRAPCPRSALHASGLLLCKARKAFHSDSIPGGRRTPAVLREAQRPDQPGSWPGSSGLDTARPWGSGSSAH